MLPDHMNVELRNEEWGNPKLCYPATLIINSVFNNGQIIFQSNVLVNCEILERQNIIIMHFVPFAIEFVPRLNRTSANIPVKISSYFIII